MVDFAGSQGVSNKRTWFLMLVYLALAGSFWGLELDTFVQDLPFFQPTTLLLFVNVLFVMLGPPLAYLLVTSARSLRGSRLAIAGILLINTIYFYVAAFLAVYKSVRKMDFDFDFFWYNRAEALPALWKIYGLWLPVVGLSMAAFLFLQKAAFSPLGTCGRKTRKITASVLTAAFVLSLTSQIATLDTGVRGSMAGFGYSSFLSDRRLRSDYHDLYREHIESLMSAPPLAIGKADPSMLGDVVFFVKQESLNGLLVQPRITPQLLNASRDGILFRDFYGNSIQSIRGYESILCGVPPNIAGALIDEYTPNELRNLACLPRIFKSLGYHPLYFFGGSRNPRVMRFAESIGFEEVLADNIAQPGDVKFDWGYREDIFYRRVYEYLQSHHKNEKLFVFIDTGATNHTPFRVLDDKLLDRIPYPRAETFQERISNTTFVQDAYFGYFYSLFKATYGPRGSMLLASDHSWPISIHKNNIYNERGAYEENFRIALLFVPPGIQKGRFATGTAVTPRFSQMDIAPTVLDLIGLEQDRFLGESFASWLMVDRADQRTEPARTKISVQPYGGGFISAVQYPRKYVLDVLGQKCTFFDLQRDPQEEFPKVFEGDEHASIVREFFHPETHKPRTTSSQFAVRGSQ